MDLRKEKISNIDKVYYDFILIISKKPFTEPKGYRYAEMPRLSMSSLNYSIEKVSNVIQYNYLKYQEWGNKYNQSIDLNNWLVGRTFVYCKGILARLRNRMLELKELHNKQKYLTCNNLYLFTTLFIGFLNYVKVFTTVYYEGSALTFDDITWIAKDVSIRSEIFKKKVVNLSKDEMENIYKDILYKMTKNYALCYNLLRDLLPEYIYEHNLLMKNYITAIECYLKVQNVYYETNV
jgi:hypothetical protein